MRSFAACGVSRPYGSAGACWLMVLFLSMRRIPFLHVKLMQLEEALHRFVPNGASVVMGTALEALIPFAAGHALIREHKEDLELIGPISDMLFDQLIGAG